jgi:hypothetical protein
MVFNKLKHRVLGLGIRGLTIATVATLVACVSVPPRDASQAVATTPAPSVEVYFYPTKGQTTEQQERDRYECYLWARDQTGYDPSAPHLAPNQQVRVEAAPSGQGALTGAIAGAVLGAAVSRRGEKAEGAAQGAIAGAMIGGASEAAQAEQSAQQEQVRLDAERATRLEQKASNYRRAMAACLEGRGYNVR